MTHMPTCYPVSAENIRFSRRILDERGHLLLLPNFNFNPHTSKNKVWYGKIMQVADTLHDYNCINFVFACAEFS